MYQESPVQLSILSPPNERKSYKHSHKIFHSRLMMGHSYEQAYFAHARLNYGELR